MQKNLYSDEKRSVVTLDAGGTNFVFGAMRGDRYIVDGISRKSNYFDLQKCLATMRDGFGDVIKRLSEAPAAISFAFPGPADYGKGIIGGYVPNFPAFRSGVALADFLEAEFKVPVYINNDADLFVYGESLAGALPEINLKLAASGRRKRYANLLGYTLGTGFGFGFVSGGFLHKGDNDCVETFCLKNTDNSGIIAEDYVSASFIVDYYGETASSGAVSEPKEVFEIAEGTRGGDIEAARETFAKYGMYAGDAIATAVTLIDGLVVLGGGISAASKYFMPSLLSEMRSYLSRRKGGEKVPRLQSKVYNLDDGLELAEFLKKDRVRLEVFGTDKFVDYNPSKKIGICVSKLGAERAVAFGAYAYAIDMLDGRIRK